MNKKDLIYLSILFFLILILIFQITYTKKIYIEKENTFFDVNPDQLNKIVLSIGSDSIIFIKKKSDWIVGYPVEFTIDKNKRTIIEKQIIPVKSRGLPISENSKYFGIYNVSEENHQAIIGLFQKRWHIFNFLFGQFGQTWHQFCKKRG